MSEFKPINTQEEFDNAIAERLAREKKKYADYDKFKADSEKLAELEGKDYNGQLASLQSELDKAKNQLAEKDTKTGELLARAEKAEKSLLRRTIAEAHKIPTGLADRIHGETEEEMKKDAQTLAGFIKKQEDPAPLAEGNDGGEGKWGSIISSINN